MVMMEKQALVNTERTVMYDTSAPKEDTNSRHHWETVKTNICTGYSALRIMLKNKISERRREQKIQTGLKVYMCL